MTTHKYRAKGGGFLNNMSGSIDSLTRLAMKNLNLQPNYTRKQSAGMAPPMGAPPPNQGPMGPPAAESNPSDKKELNKVKKELKTSKKKNKKLNKRNKSLKIENNDLRKKLTSVSEDIVKLQEVLPNVNEQIKQMLKDINAYKVFKTDNERNNSKMSIEEPYLKKNPEPEQGKPDYNSFLKKTKKTKKTKKKASNNKASNNKASKESNV